MGKLGQFEFEAPQFRQFKSNYMFFFTKCSSYNKYLHPAKTSLLTLVFIRHPLNPHTPGGGGGTIIAAPTLKSLYLIKSI